MMAWAIRAGSPGEGCVVVLMPRVRLAGVPSYAFRGVPRRELLRVYQDVEFSPDDLPGYAMRVFDFAMGHPDLMRLIAWANLEQGARSPAERAAAHDEKVAQLRAARGTGELGTALPPSFLLIAIMALATAWSAANPFGLPVAPSAADNTAELREHIASAARLLARHPPPPRELPAEE
jgi:hypothetical protein